MNNKLLIIIILILTPYFWWNLAHPKNLSTELLKLPQYLSNQRKTLFSADKISVTEDARWYSLNQKIGRLFFNKLYIIPNEIFYGFQAISPHNFFSSAGTYHSTPEGIPAIPFIFLPFSLMGIYQLIKTKKYLPLVLFFSTIFIPILTGQPTLYYLLPTYLIYLYFTYSKLKLLKNKVLLNVLLFTLAYNLYVIGRILIL
jgi:hypothetical protein